MGAMIDHSSRDGGSGVTKWLCGAVLCGALPLCAGVLLCVLYLFVATDKGVESAWPLAGVTVLSAGLALFALGLVLLAVYLLKGRREGLEMRELLQNSVLTLCLLCSNFPVAVACIWVANYEMSAYRLQLTNESTEALEHILVTWPGDKAVIDELQAGESHELKIHPSGDGAVHFNAIQGGETCEGELVGYVTPNLSGQTEVVFVGDCAIEITDK